MQRPILIVDDDPSVCLLAKRCLETVGWQVLAVGSGGEAIRLIEGGLDPCLVILDLMMPVMDGNDLLTWLKGQGVQAPLVILTGHVGELRVDHGNAVLAEKPLGCHELRRVVADTMTRSGLRMPGGTDVIGTAESGDVPDEKKEDWQCPP